MYRLYVNVHKLLLEIIIFMSLQKRYKTRHTSQEHKGTQTRYESFAYQFVIQTQKLCLSPNRHRKT